MSYMWNNKHAVKRVAGRLQLCFSAVNSAHFLCEDSEFELFLVFIDEYKVYTSAVWIKAGVLQLQEDLHPVTPWARGDSQQTVRMLAIKFYIFLCISPAP